MVGVVPRWAGADGRSAVLFLTIDLASAIVGVSAVVMIVIVMVIMSIAVVIAIVIAIFSIVSAVPLGSGADGRAAPVLQPEGSVLLALHYRHRHHGRIGADGRTAAVLYPEGSVLRALHDRHRHHLHSHH